MAIEAKTSFLRQMEKKLETETTASTMAKVLSIVADVMEGFDFHEITSGETHDDLLQCYLEAMKVQGRSEKTIAHYNLVLRKMLSDVNVPIRSITVYHLRRHLGNIKETNHLKDSTLESYRSIYSAFFRWLFRESLISKNPVDNLGTIKVPKVVKDVFTDIDMELLRQSCSNVRDRAIVAFLASTGCRVSELCSLKRDQVDLQNMECIVHGKGNKERTVYMDSITAMMIRNYFEIRTDDSDTLFATKLGVKFQEGGIRDMLKRLEERSGVTHVHPHKFRRTFATNMARRGMPIQTIAKLMGHDKIETTMTYVVLYKEDTKYAYKHYYAS